MVRAGFPSLLSESKALCGRTEAGHREGKMGRCAAVRIAAGPKFPVMRGNNAAADRETQPHSLLFSADERLEYLFHFLLRDTPAHVDD